MHFYNLLLVFILFSQDQLAWSHGGHGPDSGAASQHVELPVEISLDGDISFHIPGVSERSGGHGTEGGDEHGHAEEGPFHIAPEITSGVDRVRRVFSKTRTPLGRSTGIWSPAQAEDGWFVQDRRAFEIGMGAGLEFELGGGVPGVFHMGLSPVVGRNLISLRSVHTLDEVKALPRATIPREIEDWESRGLGDLTSWTSEGGVRFHAGVSFLHIIGVAGISRVTGTWGVRVLKLGPQDIRVTLTRERLAGMGVEVEGLLMNAYSELLDIQSRGFSFSINPQTAQARAAYQAAIRGRINELQEFAQKPESGVRAMQSEKSHSVGVQTRTGFAFPSLISVGAGKGRSITTVESDDYEQGYHGSTYATIFTEGHEVQGILSRHLRKSESWASSHSTAQWPSEDGVAGDLDVNFATTYTWTYERDRVRDERVEKHLSTIGKKLGLLSLLRVEFPNHHANSFQIEVSSRFSQFSVSEAMKILPTLAPPVSQFDQVAKSLVGDPVGKSAYCGPKNRDRCIRKLGEKAVDAFRKAQSKAHAMARLISSKTPKDLRAFTGRQAEWLKAITSSPVLYQWYVRNVPGVRAIVTTRGTQFAINQFEIKN